MRVLFPGSEGLVEGNASMLWPLVGRPCGLLGIVEFLSLFDPEDNLCVPWGDRFLCSRSTEALQMGTTGRPLVGRGLPGNSVNIFVFRYSFSACVHISGIYNSALDV